jgi:hypothetical protein
VKRSGARLVFGKRLGLDHGTKHLQQLTKKATLLKPVKLDPGKLD